MFNNYREIVTKTIVGKGKKTFKNEYEISVNNNVDTVLGCWVINHHIKGIKDGEYIKINGSFDVNIWYSYDNNTKTDVVNNNVSYEERVRVTVKNDDISDTDVIIRSLKNPSCTDVSSENNIIKYTISKELGIEIVGDTKIKIPISNNEDEYDIIIDEDTLGDEIEKSVNVKYLEDKEKNIVKE